MILSILFGVAFGAAFLSWVFAAVHWILAVRNRRPDIPMSKFISQGTLAFDPENFTPKGQKYQGRLVKGFMAFFGSLGVGIAVAITAATLSE